MDSDRKRALSSTATDVVDDLDTRTLLALIAHRKFNGVPPTVREIAAVNGVDYMVVHRSLRRLRRQGLVTWERGNKRTLRALVEVTT